jgi:hypothetical protein
LEGLEDDDDYVPEDQARLVEVRPASSNHRSVRSSRLVHQGDSFNAEEVSKTLQSTRPTHHQPLKRAQLTADPANQAKSNARPLKRGSNKEDAPIRKGAKTIKKLSKPEPKPDPLSRYRHLLNHDKSDRVVCLPILYHDPQARTKLAFNAWQLLRLYDLSLRPWHCFESTEQIISFSNESTEYGVTGSCLFRPVSHMRRTVCFSRTSELCGQVHFHKKHLQSTWAMILGCGQLAEADWIDLVHSGAGLKNRALDEDWEVGHLCRNETYIKSSHERAKITKSSPQHAECRHLLGHEKQDRVVCLPLT